MRTCRLCDAPLDPPFLDLGPTPLANSYQTVEQLEQIEFRWPLRLHHCGRCHLVQIGEYGDARAIFSDYLYFSSYSDSWVAQCRDFAHAMIPRLGLGSGSLVIEVASNDGYLLSSFQEKSIPVLGIEPAANVAKVARERGVDTLEAYLDAGFARRYVADGGRRADLLVANNVLAHNPALHSFVEGLATLLAPEGVLTVELPHLLPLVEHGEFDTVYHEHYSYFSLHAACRLLESHGLLVFDVDELPTHGGSLRLHVQHATTATRPADNRVAGLLARERESGLLERETYDGLARKAWDVKRALVRFLLDQREAGRRVAAYGAPAKATTLLNYCGIRHDLLPFTVDRSPHKQGRHVPGTGIPIRAPAAIAAERPDYLLILPWNLKDEIMQQMVEIRDWGGRFVVPIPRLEVL